MTAVARLCLSVWLAVFAIQSADLLTIVAPDSCTEEVQGSPEDPCADGCARCVCCARVPVFIPQAILAVVSVPVARADVPLFADPAPNPAPRGVFHVPKHSLI